MNILFVSLAVWPELFEFVSGGERHFIEVCRRWISMGHKIQVLTTKVGAESLVINGIKAETVVIDIPFERFLCKTSIGLSLLYVLRVLKSFQYLFIISTSQFDIICSVSGFACDVIPSALIAKRTRSKLAIYAHALIPPPTLRQYQSVLPNILVWFSEQISLTVAKKIGSLIFICPADVDHLVAIGWPRNQIGLIYNAIDHDRVNRTAPSLDKYDACFVGRIAPTKGVIDLVTVWKIVCEVIPNAKLVIVGGGGSQEYYNKLLKSIKEHSLVDKIVCVGSVPENEKFSLLKSSKVFLFPSYEEGWGITICEAMACGLPTVAYDLPAYRYAFQQSIVTVPIGDKRQLANEAIKIFRNVELSNKLKNKSLLQASKYNWDLIASKEIQDITCLLKNNGVQN